MEAGIPYTIVGQNGGRILAFGFTYAKSENPNYAIFIYSHIGGASLYLVRCYDNIWTAINLVK